MFCRLRAAFGIDNKDYLLSLTGDKCASPLSAARSASVMASSTCVLAGGMEVSCVCSLEQLAQQAGCLESRALSLSMQAFAMLREDPVSEPLKCLHQYA